jgi:peptidoglycan/xylan/chitin deacetylase (PgdA/CDA1 family)
MNDFSLTAVMYHYVREPGDAAEAGSGIPGLATRQFEAQLDYLRQNYDMIAWPDLRAYLQNGTPLPARPCLLTFDDGVCDHYLNAFPAMHKRGLSGLFFAMAGRADAGLTFPHKIHFLQAVLGLEVLREVLWARMSAAQRERYKTAEVHYSRWYRNPTDVFKTVVQRDMLAGVDGLVSELFEAQVGSEREIAARYYLTAGQIREMAAGGMHFGGHSQTHPWFDWISVNQLNDEIAASAAWLPDVEPGPWAFAYPYGGLTDEAPPLFAAHGFGAAFTTRDTSEHHDRFFIGRIDGEEIMLNGGAAKGLSHG